MTEQTHSDDYKKPEPQFTAGEKLRFVRVRFPGHAKSYPFLAGKRKFIYGQKVVAMSDRGMAVGYVNSFVYELPYKEEMGQLKSIKKIATQEDIDLDLENTRKQKETEVICQRLIEKHQLEMNLTHVEFTQFGKKVVFYFNAPARVDFRGLVKDLVSELKLRIELRQISVRDRAASQGALGPCGRELCCSSFLSRYGNVTLKMAKNQNLSLNFSKLNGVCGQLKCCLQYEDEVYSQKRKKLPKENDFIKTHSGHLGKVLRVQILGEQFDLIDKEGVIRRFTAEMFDKSIDKIEMPKRFPGISDQTSSVIGLAEYQEKLSKKFTQERHRASLEALSIAKNEFEKHSGIEIDGQQVTPFEKELIKN